MITFSRPPSLTTVSSALRSLFLQPGSDDVEIGFGIGAAPSKMILPLTVALVTTALPPALLPPGPGVNSNGSFSFPHDTTPSRESRHRVNRVLRIGCSPKVISCRVIKVGKAHSVV